MDTLFKKLQLPLDIDEILILNEPEGFCEQLNDLDSLIIKESLIQVSVINFALVFVTEMKQIENRIETMNPKLVGDVTLWFAYPKKSSKNYKSEITKEIGWGVLGDYNLRAIQQVSINDDWNALRFKRIQFIESPISNSSFTIDKTEKTGV